MHYLRSNVLQFEWGRAGLCGGKLLGPSILRVIKELLSISLTSFILLYRPADILFEYPRFKDEIIAFCSCKEQPGVLEADKCLGDEGTLCPL